MFDIITVLKPKGEKQMKSNMDLILTPTATNKDEIISKILSEYSDSIESSFVSQSKRRTTFVTINKNINNVYEKLSKEPGVTVQIDEPAYQM